MLFCILLITNCKTKFMRRIIYAIFFIFLGLNCFAQKNEIGLHLLSHSPHLFNTSTPASFLSKDQLDFIWLSGATYKRKIDDKHALRASLIYRRLTSELPDTGYPYGVDGNFREYAIKTGYERAFNTNTFSPYIGADASLFLSRYDGFASSDFATNDFLIKGRGFGLSPFIGLTFNITNHMSLSAESSADFIMFTYNHRDVTMLYNGSNKENLNVYTRKYFESRFNPLQKLSLNVKF